MRIGILCHPTFGGSGVVASECALSLAEHGHRVHLFSPGVPPRLAHNSGAVVLHRVHGLDYPLFANSHAELAATGAVLDVIASEGLDVLHAHYALPHAVSAHLAREAARVNDAASVPRLVVTLHGTDVTLVAAAPAYAPLLRYVLGCADAVTAVSRDLSIRLRDWWGTAAGPIETLPNFVDTHAFAPRAEREPGPLRSIHVSNFRPLKRVPWLIEAFARASQGGDASLTLVGDGPELPRCRDLAAELGLGTRVRFLGERRDLPALLAAHDAFLLTSREESFGLSALEASSCGLGVLATRVGGLPEVVQDGAGGRLVAPDDQNAFVRELVAWIADPARAHAFGVRGRARATADFDRDTGVQRYADLYTRLLDR
ncbi:MAG: N-acetyl-alpha-D-glucosaminyl L-malate synthase BshA [Planctomycetes bacterium]|nr:N-acetyl-alpha-D-glucosaminyl L-malate synthase BshA [Planctomycetota bacterium]MCB9905125.1 N-acetyl-alpha-D-glucosaminyl L-malate synthase BshA [Planctomycetota bacterium]